MAAAPTPIPPWIDWSHLWQILVLGLIAGAGLPALFAVGLRALALRGGNGTQTVSADSDEIVGGNPLGIVLGAICFLIVLGAIGWGIWAIWVAGHPK
jgi:hypothetical protein